MKSFYLFGITVVLFIMTALTPIFVIPYIAFFVFGVAFAKLVMEIKYEKGKMQRLYRSG